MPLFSVVTEQITLAFSCYSLFHRNYSNQSKWQLQPNVRFNMFTLVAVTLSSILCMHKHNKHGSQKKSCIIAFVGIHIVHQAVNHALMAESSRSTEFSTNISRYLICQEIIDTVTYDFCSRFHRLARFSHKETIQ